LIPVPLDTSRVSGYDFGAPVPAGGWTGTGQTFGWLTHQGVDYGTKVGSAIVAPFAGTTKFEQGLLGYGNRLTLTLANGWKFVFGHVAQGSNGPVAAGARIGTTGQNVGSSQGSVTLVEVHNPAGQAVNPHSILDPIFKGTATVTGLFGAASGQLLALADQKAVTTPAPATLGQAGSGSVTPGIPAQCANLTGKALLDCMAANLTLPASGGSGAFGPSPATGGNDPFGITAGINAAADKVTTATKPITDFFNSVGNLIQPKHLWTSLFVVIGAGMVVSGLVMYFKGGEIVQAAQGAAKDAAVAA
jgi:hypothetical protein